jgi:HSP20 family protein
MAEVNVQGKSEERGRSLERRTPGGGLFRRGPWGFPGLHRGSEDLFTMNPFTLMRRFTEDMDRMFSGFGTAMPEMGAWAPPVEVRESDGNLIISAELPGLNKEDVRVEVNNDSVVIQGERKREWDEEKGGVHRTERSYGMFYRSIPLPEGVKTDQVKAQFNNGVLEIQAPIPEASRKTRQVPIEGGAERKSVTSQAAGQQPHQSKAG